MKDLYLVFKNLTRKKMRLFLTLFATFIAFTIFGTLTAFQKAFDSGVDLAADDRLIVVNKINFTQVLPISYVNRIAAVDDVEALTHLNWFGGYYQDPRNQMGMFAVDAENFLDVYPELLVTDEERESWFGNRQGLIAGESIAKRFGWEKGDRIPVNSNIFSKRDGSTSWDFDVVAIYQGEEEQTDTSSVYFHYEYFNETQSFGGDFVGFIGLRTSDPSRNEAVITEIDDMFANSPAETETVPEKAFNKAFLEQIGNLSLILTSVVFAAFFVILVIVGNSMMLSIRERTAEIGVMKTLGFTSTRIFRMVLSESLLLALLGGVLGLLASRLLVVLVNEAPIQLPTLVVDGRVWTDALLFMIGLGFVTGIVPAVNALRLNIITALSRG
ncbi:MAG: FtsX-like permease family protein [Pseudomonadota bacterium]